MKPHWTASEEEIAAYNKSIADNRLWHMIAHYPAENCDKCFEEWEEGYAAAHEDD